MKNTIWKYKSFYGVEIPEEEIKSGYLSYKTLAKSFDLVMVNNIEKLFYNVVNGEYIEPELVNGCDYNEETETPIDIYQYFIIDNNGVDILQNNTNEIVYYIDFLDVYVWGVTHFGACWSGVDTDIKIKIQG